MRYRKKVVAAVAVALMIAGFAFHWFASGDVFSRHVEQHPSVWPPGTYRYRVEMVGRQFSNALLGDQSGTGNPTAKYGPHALAVGSGRGGSSVIPPQQRWIMAVRA